MVMKNVSANLWKMVTLTTKQQQIVSTNFDMKKLLLVLLLFFPVHGASWEDPFEKKIIIKFINY